MQNQIELSRAKLRLIEGQQLTQRDQQLLLEVAPAMLLIGFLDNVPLINEVKAWAETKVSELAKNALPKEVLDTWAELDKIVAQALGSEDASMGSMITMLLWNLVTAKGQTINAVMAMLKQSGRELIAAKASAATGITKDSLVQDAVQMATSNEPWADRIEQQLAKFQQQYNAAQQPTVQIAQTTPGSQQQYNAAQQPTVQIAQTTPGSQQQPTT